MANDAVTNLDLVEVSSQAVRVSLKRLQIHEASKILEVWLAPNGDNDTILRKKKLAAVEWGTKARSGNPSRQKAWQTL